MATSGDGKAAGGIIVLVGTMKGAFILRSDGGREKWTVNGPHFRGEAVYAMLHDTHAGCSTSVGR